MKSVCFVDDQQLALDAFNAIFRRSVNFEVIGLFVDAEHYVNQFPTLQPNITVIDLDLPGMSGTEAIIIIKSCYPDAKIVVLTNYSDDNKLFNALRAGADGYLLKKDAIGALENALISVLEGGAPMTPEIARKVVLHFQKQTGLSNFTILSEKEKIVLQHLVEGLLYKEIASCMSVTIDAIKKHAQNIYEKLHVRTRSEAVRKYLTNGV